MPDWTYHPLRGAAAAVLGRRRSQLAALRLLAGIGSRPGGARLIARGFGHRHPPARLAGEVAGVPVTVRLGISVPPSLARDAVRAMPPLGAGVVEVAPVSAADVQAVREAAAGRSIPVLVRSDDPEVEAALKPYVDGFTHTDNEPRITHGPTPAAKTAPKPHTNRPTDTDNEPGITHGPTPAAEATPKPYVDGPTDTDNEPRNTHGPTPAAETAPKPHTDGLTHTDKTPLEPRTDVLTPTDDLPSTIREPAPSITADHAHAAHPAPRVVRVSSPSVATAAAVLAEPGAVVLVRPAVLVSAGPGWFARVVEAATPTGGPAPGLRDVGWDPRRWPAWWWALVVGAGMVFAGLCAAAITLGPVLLWYDRDYLGMTVHDLHAVNHHLVHFLQHDRITMAGTMVSIGALYTGLAVGGIRRGLPWAREVFLVSGAVGFPTLFYFLATGFVEPLHTAAALVLFPMFVAAVRRTPHAPPRWRPVPEGPEPERRRALVGQLLLIVTGAGLFVGGAVISVVGLTGVFVPTDLTFLGSSARALEAVNPRLVPFVAHDRAGFGGALMSAAVAIVLLSAWGWRRGESWVFWTLAVAAAAGFLPAVVVHGAIHYTDFVHLAPVYFGIALTATGLLLARPYLCARS
ncbi:hypothetical protein [Streptomyces sp. NPDC018693]|uniref:hypothetical protein n=1 Tax=unclassified Streptomyces TaxID=2593676 RepID=UPI0037BBC29E